jgi:glutamine synthetase type III
LKLKYDDPLSNFAFNFHLRHYVMAALIAAVDKYGDLMRLSVACPGNDFRLGAMEVGPRAQPPPRLCHVIHS